MARMNPRAGRPSGGPPQAPRQTMSNRFRGDLRHENKRPKEAPPPLRGHPRGGFGGFSAQDARLKRRAKGRRLTARKRRAA